MITRYRDAIPVSPVDDLKPVVLSGSYILAFPPFLARRCRPHMIYDLMIVIFEGSRKRLMTHDWSQIHRSMWTAMLQNPTEPARVLDPILSLLTPCSALCAGDSMGITCHQKSRTITLLLHEKVDFSSNTL